MPASNTMPATVLSLDGRVIAKGAVEPLDAPGLRWFLLNAGESLPENTQCIERAVLVVGEQRYQIADFALCTKHAESPLAHCHFQLLNS